MKPNRLEAFSDGVIAIIITIMVLELKVPAEAEPRALLKLWPIFLSYGLSYLLVAIYWMNHHALVHLIHRVDGRMLWANANLLFWMSLIPWATEYMGHYTASAFALALYGGVQLACCWGFFAFRAAVLRPRVAHEPAMAALNRALIRKNLIAAAVYAGAIAMAYVSRVATFALILTPAVMYFLPERRVTRMVEEPAVRG